MIDFKVTADKGSISVVEILLNNIGFSGNPTNRTDYTCVCIDDKCKSFHLVNENMPFPLTRGIMRELPSKSMKYFVRWYHQQVLQMHTPIPKPKYH